VGETRPGRIHRGRLHIRLFQGPLEHPSIAHDRMAQADRQPVLRFLIQSRQRVADGASQIEMIDQRREVRAGQHRPRLDQMRQPIRTSRGFHPRVAAQVVFQQMLQPPITPRDRPLQRLLQRAAFLGPSRVQGKERVGHVVAQGPRSKGRLGPLPSPNRIHGPVVPQAGVGRCLAKRGSVHKPHVAEEILKSPVRGFAARQELRRMHQK